MTESELNNCKNDTMEMYNKFKKLCNDDSITCLTHEDRDYKTEERKQ